MVASNSSYTEISACIVVRVPRGRDQMVVGFIATCSARAYHHQIYEFESRSWRGVLDAILCESLSMTCDISVVFAGYSGFIHQ